MRSRFNNVVNVRDVPQEDYSEPSGRYQVGGREIAEVVGARDLGYSVTFVAPGSRSYPFHFHHGEEGRSTCSKAAGSCARATARAPRS